MRTKHHQSIYRPRQLDWRWIDRYRELDGYDAYWWCVFANVITY